FVLIDCRHDPQPIDKEFMEYMGEKQIPFSIIFTKADKLKPKALERNIENYKQALLEGAWLEMPNYFVSSASNSEGKEEILEYIGSINEQLKDQ
ncbi:MAG: YihA family ribosome biogenesis GTP-binding protein, partial [Leeuwenhoekiella sp.]|nr:YihA family ribosome biogenesis GTP-binding protein [Leeuwenhoekiella sp.]